ncbi:hypothetical protein SAMN05216207_104630 [Pseudonocardia ammonioxydans]|uniref:Uncharacterized protein n=1 Tax=Pseudonocardia ammonioxydans TaxID=260086 RepID=A0A1I5GFW0_PSUAM|nr:hypothetical protein [Pseudonocardia ammonioxydans]SFO34806.1 hypothetical protein SAMN05216207_104630 [Pseudonocardia ammonioxydans]
MPAAPKPLVRARMVKARALQSYPADHPVARDATRRYAVIRARYVLADLMAGVDPLHPDEVASLVAVLPQVARPEAVPA